MPGRATIGEFSTMTRLSRKSLRHYHELGLLEPAEIDPVTSYRYYDSTQVEIARVIRQLRDLDMPVPEVKSYLMAAGDRTRNEILAGHLDRMQAQLQQTQDTIASLRALIQPGVSPPIQLLALPPAMAVAITEVVALADLIEWWRAGTRELDDVLRAAGIAPSGPLGALYDHALFADERGEATVWFPVGQAVPGSGRARMAEIPGGSFAVVTHDGPDSSIDQTYAALGAYVTERRIGGQGPVRERYLAGVLDDPAPLITEIAWPVLASGQPE